MAVPKRRTSSAKRDQRRASVSKVKAVAIQKCPNCGEYKRTHRVCDVCGYYNGKQVIVKEEA